jgi:hypothetical protein
LILLASVVWLSGCSAIKLAYNSADDLAYWWLDGYFDFAATQSAAARSVVSDLHRWHRREELPHYIELLERGQKLALGEVTTEQTCALFAEANARIDALGPPITTALATLATPLKPAQFESLRAKLEKNRLEWQRDWIDLEPAERDEKRLERLIDSVERFYVRIDAPQREALQELVRSVPFESGLIQRDMRRRHEDLLTTLQRFQRQSDAALLSAWFDRVRHTPDAEYAAYLDRVRESTCRSMARLHNSTSPEQRRRLNDRLRDYADDLRTLVRQGG